MDSDFKVPNGVTAGQIPYGVASEEKNHSSIARHIAELVEGMPLIG